MGIFCYICYIFATRQKSDEGKLFVYLNALRLWKIIMIDN